MAGWRLMLAEKLGDIGGHDCLICQTGHGEINLVSQGLLHWYIEAISPAELIALNCLLSNARAAR